MREWLRGWLSHGARLLGRVYAAVSAASLVIGMPGIPADVAGWAFWLQPLNTDWGRWFLVFSSTLALLFSGDIARVIRWARQTPPVALGTAPGPLIARHDQVCWEYNENASFYDPSPVLGPLCPEDYATLLFRPGARPDGRSRPVGWDNVLIGPGAETLHCPTCRREFVLDPDRNKFSNESRQEAQAVLEGERRRRARLP